jgi:Sec-independent protein translocase protein TatA
LMHRYELFASFWPAVGWIGGVFVIINEEGRVHQWHESKVTAWLPIPLIYLGCFLLLWLFYLAAKQAARVEMWQALSGAAARRIHKKERKRPAVGALPRKNIIPILVVAVLLFGVTAVLAPYLWRTGRGDKESKNQQVEDEGKGKDEKDSSPRKAPSIDGEAIMQQMQKLANAAKETLPKLWPLLLLILLYRPAKRALLLTHLKSPIVPTPPSERIDNLWEYVRIAAEDAGVVPTSADSVEQLIARFPKDRVTPALTTSAEIYIRTRYGFTVQKGDAITMRGHAADAAKALRKDLGAWVTIKNWWRPLS